MNIIINTDLEIDADTISNACTPEELGSLISDCANKLAEKTNFDLNRQVASHIRDGLSERGKQLLVHAFAVDYMHLINKNKVNE